MEIDPDRQQGQVVNWAREQARNYLRNGCSFVWNTTNLSRQLRRQCIGLFADYHACIRIVYVETSEERLLRQNRQRQTPVPPGSPGTAAGPLGTAGQDGSTPRGMDRRGPARIPLKSVCQPVGHFHPELG
jgi:hypothetical protein